MKTKMLMNKKLISQEFQTPLSWNNLLRKITSSENIKKILKNKDNSIEKLSASKTRKYSNQDSVTMLFKSSIMDTSHLKLTITTKFKTEIRSQRGMQMLVKK